MCIFSVCLYWSRVTVHIESYMQGTNICNRNDSWRSREVIQNEGSPGREVSLISRVTMNPCHVSNPSHFTYSLLFDVLLSSPTRFVAATRWMPSTNSVFTGFKTSTDLCGGNTLTVAYLETYGWRCKGSADPAYLFKYRWPMRVRRLPPRLNWILASSGLLRGVKWFETDVLGLPIGLGFKGQVLQR